MDHRKLKIKTQNFQKKITGGNLQDFLKLGKEFSNLISKAQAIK